MNDSGGSLIDVGLILISKITSVNSNDHISQSTGFSDLDDGTQALFPSFAYNTGPNVFTAPKGYETLRKCC